MANKLLTATLAIALTFTLSYGELQSGSSEEEMSSPNNDEAGINDYEPDESAISNANPHGTPIVGPLLKTQWNQRDPFNIMLPPGSAPNGHELTDCSVAAMAQIMKFHNYPKKFKGPLEPGIKKLSAADKNKVVEVEYDWDNMLDKYTPDATEKQRNAVALLVYHINGWRFGRFGEKEQTPLKSFGYDKSMLRLYRQYFDDSTWTAIIREQLDMGLPVYIWGCNSAIKEKRTTGHTFVIDGYDNTGKFHINWGWAGKKDGYYSLNALKPDSREFHYSNTIIINIKPDEGGVGSNKWIALDLLTVDKNTVAQNELFNVTAKISQKDNFSGHAGVALVDNKGNIAAVVGSVGVRSNLSIKCFVPDTVKPGQYSLRIVTRPVGGEWKTVTLYDRAKSNYTAVDFKVNAGNEPGAPGGGYGMAVSEFSAETQLVSVKKAFKVTMKLKNIGIEKFPGGQFGVALIDKGGNIVEVIRKSEYKKELNVGGYWHGSVTCKIPETVSSGKYRLRIVVKQAGNDVWRVATMSVDNIPTSLDITVN